MEHNPIAFGQALRASRLRAGLTQRKLAEQAGVSLRTIRHIEQGQVERPRQDSIRRLAAALESRGESPWTGSGGALRIGVLGPLEAARGDEPVALGPLKQRSLFAVLALQPNEVVSREEIIDVLWGDRPPASCLNLVHTYVSGLRKLVEPSRARESGAVISLVSGGYRLTADPGELDLTRFDELVAQARRAPHGEARKELFEQALDLWRGPVLADLPPNVRQHPVAVALAGRRVTATLAYADTALAVDGAEDAIDRLRLVAHHEPLHESLHGRLMLALAAAGQQAAALRVFADIRRRLGEELGIQPGKEIRLAHGKVVEGEPVQHESRPAQLPAEVAGFVGRGEQVRALTASGASIVAITGAAGVGKTALAVHWAHRLRTRFPDGQLHVDLRGHTSGQPMRPIEALSRFLRALGVSPGRIPAGEDEAAALFRTTVADRRVLVVLDNAVDAAQTRPLLCGAAGCLTIITSRDALAGLSAAEGTHRLPLDVLAPEDARLLLTKLVGDAEPAEVAELARVSAYLPLALRVAGASIASAPHGTVAGYLAERVFPGGGDVRSAAHEAFDRSYRRLDPAARRLFRLLGFVPGPDFTAEAAAALGGDGAGRTRDLLTALGAAGLVHEPVPGRFQLHDLLREYAISLPSGDEPPAAAERLFAFYLHRADGATRLLYPHVPRLPVPQGKEPPPANEADALGWLDAERANLLAAVAQAVEYGLPSYAWRITDALRGYLCTRGYNVEGIAACQEGLRAARQEDDLAAECSMRGILGLIRYGLGDHPAAIECHTSALALARRVGDRLAEAAALHNLGRVYARTGHHADESSHYEEALEINRKAGNLHGEASALNHVGVAALALGQIAKAVECSTAALELSRELGDPDLEARSMHNLGLTHWARGELDEAIDSFSECLRIVRLIGNRNGEAPALVCLAEAHCEAGRYAEAEVRARMAIAQARASGERRDEVGGLHVVATVYLRTGHHEAAARYYRKALALAKEIGYSFGEMSVLIGLSVVDRESGRADSAVRDGERVLELVRHSGSYLLEAKVLIELAHARVALGELGQARARAGEALVFARNRGQYRDQARALVVLGLVREAAGEREGAAEAWKSALELFGKLSLPEVDDVTALLDRISGDASA
ncbi:DNA-binding transcriptional activator of the SARP family [Amycolatopsis xylanica]|uniref:DNA-binding transcriptional activator of the SARP family n=1 Tax=Amycolatopsis xylanica TaxID=589385 RepID=A0A1H3DEC5_9PSEU|nr:tetratricopeptide repeat protein [Amycolatopsis xylanica]SDX64803.1 DNA-binding transcriptional activator of the SARP family [Amycolatopsis xylanica]